MSDSDEEQPAIVLDFGADTVRAGFSGDDAPRSVLPCFNCPDWQYPGDVKRTNNDMRYIRYPFKSQQTNWDGIENIIQFVYDKELKVSSRGQAVLWTAPIFEPKENKLKVAELMFERFESQAFYSSSQAHLASYASGRGSGIFVDSGHRHTQIVMIYEGFMIEESCCKIEVGGSHLTEHLQSLIEQNNSRQLTLEICRDIKNKHSYCVANDNANEVIYTLPDAHKIDVSDAVANCVEPLFNFSLFNQDLTFNGYTSIQDMIFKSIMKADVDIRSHMFCNIIVNGGNTMITGYKDHLNSLIDPMTKISKVVASPERLYSVWIGGSILSSLSTFQQQWISRQQYEETGPNIVLEDQNHQFLGSNLCKSTFQ